MYNNILSFANSMIRSIITFTIGLLLMSGGVNDTKGVMKNYQCGRCGTVVKADHVPAVEGCYANGTHRWQDLGEMGQEIYNCKRCDTWVEAKRMPSKLNCPDAGEHYWIHLGHTGNFTYRCSRCELTIPCDRTPSPVGCSQGGTHKWSKVE